MARFRGVVGYAVTGPIEEGSDVWVETITERVYKGDITRNTRKLENGESINDNINVNNMISIVADAYAYQHFAYIKYVTWMGARWKVTNVEVQRPRLILTIGGVYNAPEE